MFKVRYSFVETQRGKRSVSVGVLWLDARDKQDARNKARDTLRAEGIDTVTIKSVHQTSIGG